MFKIIQWNMHGFYNNFTELETLIKEQSPDVISIQETHLAAGKSAAVPTQYKGFFFNLPQNNSNKQGIAVLVKKSIPHRELHIQSNIATIAIEITLSFKFTIVSIYIPPLQNISCNELRQFISSVSTPVIIAGDFNAWSPLWGSENTNTRGVIIEDLILSENLTILNDNSPTHFSTHKTFTTVDLTICSSNIAPKLTTITLSDLHGSDHYPIVTEFRTQSAYKVPPKPKFLTKKADWEMFQQVTSNLCSYYPYSDNINKEAAVITKIIRTSAHFSIPQSTNKIFPKSVPYWSTELSQLRKEKQLYWSEYKRSRTYTNLIRYKKANAIFRKKCKQAKRDCLEKFSESINHKTNPKKAWLDIKRLSGSYTYTPAISLSNSNGPITDPKEIANRFASFWSDSSHDSNFHETFVTTKNQYLSSNDNTGCTFSQYLDSKIEHIELESTLSSLSGKTPGADRISYPMLHHLPLCLKIRLLRLYNNILNQGIYPQAWKNAVIIPIPKPNATPTEVSGFRPISLLSCLGKLFEKIISMRISWHATKFNLISPQQVGFKAGQGTIDALLLFENNASTTLSNRNHLSALSIDFERAFDRVGVHVVLRQFQNWNLGVKLLNLIKDFLTNRKLAANVNNAYSNYHPLYNGIAQGSPLSVILFIAAFNEVSIVINKYKNVSHICYADDLLLFSKVNDLNAVKKDFLDILSDIARWGEVSGAKISIKKCKNFHICRKHKCNYFNLVHNDIPIVNTTSLKFLGIIFDKKLTFKEHCLDLQKQLAVRLSIVKYLSSKHCLINQSTLINVTKALLLSKIDFGLPIYGYCARSNIKLLYSPYHTAVSRSIRAFPKSPIKFILVEAGLPSIEERFDACLMKLIPKLFLCNNNTLYETVLTELQRKKTPKRKSTIGLIIDLAKELGIYSPVTSEKEDFPPWHINKSFFILELEKFNKSGTSPITYQRLFSELTNPLLSEWNMIFSDGSKTETSTSFAVVDSSGNTVSAGILPHFASVYTAEATAILNGLISVENSNLKTIICTDSRSTIASILNIRNKTYVISQIRNKLIGNNNNIKLMWVPGHAGIKGNEIADERAKLAAMEPLKTFNKFSKKDFNKYVLNYLYQKQLVTWGSTQHQYTTFNPNRLKPDYPSYCRCNDVKMFVRLRLGHTIASHSYIFNRTNRPNCQHCPTSPLTSIHLLDNCTQFSTVRSNIFGDQVPSSLLKNICYENIIKISDYLAQTDLKKLI